MPPPIERGDAVVQDGLVVGQLHKVEPLRHGELLAQGFGGDADADRAQLMTATRDRVPHEDVAIEAMRILAGFEAGIGDPVVVVCGAHLVRVAVFQWPADADDEDAGYFWRISVSRCLRGSVGYISRMSSACWKAKWSGRSG